MAMEVEVGVGLMLEVVMAMVLAVNRLFHHIHPSCLFHFI